MMINFREHEHDTSTRHITCIGFSIFLFFSYQRVNFSITQLAWNMERTVNCCYWLLEDGVVFAPLDY